jgi:hypothetical protein
LPFWLLFVAKPFETKRNEIRIEQMFKDFLTIVFLQFSVVCGALLSPSAVASSSASQRDSGFKVREPNLYAPDLYADKVDFIATLTDLPGAKKKESYWELSYELYFIPEKTYYQTIRQLPRGGSNPTPEQFPGRILLAEGHKKKKSLGSLTERTLTLTGVPFKQKVPDAERTKFALLMTHYSVRIFDAELNTTVYRSGIFLTEPYETNSEDPKQATPRRTLYLNFGVNRDGTLNGSQLPRRTGDASL